MLEPGVSEPLALVAATSAVGQPASPGPSEHLDFLSRESTFSLRIVDPKRKIHSVGRSPEKEFTS